MYFKGFPRFIINILKTRNTSIIAEPNKAEVRSRKKGTEGNREQKYIKKQQQNKTNKTKRKKERVLRLRI